MASVNVVPRFDKKKANGEVPLYLRVIKNRRTRMISLKVSIRPQFWDKANKSVKSGHPNSSRLNSYLAHKLAEANDTVIESETHRKYLSADRLKHKLLGTSTDFIRYFERYVETQRISKKHSSYKGAKSVLRKLTEYIGGSALKFEDIDVTWLMNFENHLKGTVGNSQNTAHKNLKIMRKLFNDAIKEELISPDVYPFNRYTLRKEKKQKKDYLSEEEVQQIISLAIPKGSGIDLHRNLFVFSCYSGGLRISDLLQLKWQDYDGEYLTFTTQKTSDNRSIKVPSIGRAIISLYEPKEKKATDYIFPVLKKGADKDSRTLSNCISASTALINKNLKKIAQRAGLEDSGISTHWARRTFACMALAKGLNLDVVSKLLGHSGQTVTLESYARYSQKELHKAMELFE